MEITSSFLDTWAKLSGAISTTRAHTRCLQGVHCIYNMHTVQCTYYTETENEIEESALTATEIHCHILAVVPIYMLLLHAIFAAPMLVRPTLL